MSLPPHTMNLRTFPHGNFRILTWLWEHRLVYEKAIRIRHSGGPVDEANTRSDIRLIILFDEFLELFPPSHFSFQEMVDNDEATLQGAYQKRVDDLEENFFRWYARHVIVRPGPGRNTIPTPGTTIYPYMFQALHIYPGDWQTPSPPRLAPLPLMIGDARERQQRPDSPHPQLRDNSPELARGDSPLSDLSSLSSLDRSDKENIPPPLIPSSPIKAPANRNPIFLRSGKRSPTMALRSAYPLTPSPTKTRTSSSSLMRSPLFTPRKASGSSQGISSSSSDVIIPATPPRRIAPLPRRMKLDGPLPILESGRRTGPEHDPLLILADSVDHLRHVVKTPPVAWSDCDTVVADSEDELAYLE